MEAGLKRIAVVGRAGAGKTTIALELGASLGLPVIHLDSLYWRADWTEVDREAFETRQRSAIEATEWVIDGGYLSSDGWPERLRRADLVVVVEAPLVVCLWRVLRRSVSRSTPRPDLPAGGGEQVSPYFLWWIVGWGHRHPHLAETIAASIGDGRVVVVKKLGDLEHIIRVPDP